jgi:hypothetical protein
MVAADTTNKNELFSMKNFLVENCTNSEQNYFDIV